MPAAVHILPSQNRPTCDTPSQAYARVGLKLQALAYDGIRRGADASPELVGCALASLCGSAIAYAQAVGVQVEIPDVPAPTPESSARLLRLQVVAVAYASARHGSDACAEFSRDALGQLCQLAVDYAESLPGAASRGQHVDHTLALDRG